MTFSLTYNMTTGSSISSCFLSVEALERHGELMRAGASSIVVSEDGVVLTLAELKVLADGPPTVQEVAAALKPKRASELLGGSTTVD
jgi:hypothetical protein